MLEDDADMSDLAAALVEMTLSDNEEARLAGVGKDGQPLEDIKESTIRRRRRRGDGDGPPLAPNESLSRVVTGFTATSEEVGPLHLRVTCRWPMDWLHHHTQGVPANNLPPRDIVGVRPEMSEKIHDLVRSWIQDNM